MDFTRQQQAKFSLFFLPFLAFTACLGVFAQDRSGGKDARLALVGARIYAAPGSAPIDDGVILIQNGRIAFVGQQGSAKIPPTVKTIDCRGRSVVAGFWNSHVHFTEPKWEHAARLPSKQLAEQLQVMLTRYGFTSVVDTGSLLPNTVTIRKRIESGEAAGPRILTAGSPLYPKDGVPYYVIDSVSPEIVKHLAQPGTPEEAVRVVSEQIAEGADLIKLFVVSWVRRNGRVMPLPMELPIIQAAVKEAHRKGKPVYAHPSTVAGVELILQSGVDVLAHTTEDPSRWTESLVARLKAADASLVPTLTLFSEARDFAGILKEVKTYSDAGGRILFGTDVGYLTDYRELTREFALLERAGLTFPEILAALTTAPASRFRLSARSGRIALGMDADLVILDGDPARDIGAFSKVAITMRSGRILYQTETP